MNRLNQTESAVFDSCMSSVISKDPFSDCAHLNVGFSFNIHVLPYLLGPLSFSHSCFG